MVKVLFATMIFHPVCIWIVSGFYRSQIIIQFMYIYEYTKILGVQLNRELDVTC